MDTERFCSHKDLLADGWSRGAIREFLGEPDARLPNPHCTNGAQVKAYRKDRVNQTKTTPKCLAWFEKHKVARLNQSERSISRSEGLKRQAIQTASTHLKCLFPDMNEIDMTQRAMAHHRNRVICLGKEEPLAIENGNQKYAIFINYLADHYSNLEDVTDNLYGCVGREMAERIVKTLFEARAIRHYAFLGGYRQ